MAKKNSALVVAEVQVSELTAKNKEIGGWLVASLCLLRREFVKNLNQKQFQSEAGESVIKALEHIEAKVPSIPCKKCGATGLYYSTYSNQYTVCYDCIMGRILGKPGMQHVIDVKVSTTYQKETRFQGQGPSWTISDEEIAKHKALAKKPETQSEINF